MFFCIRTICWHKSYFFLAYYLGVSILGAGDNYEAIVAARLALSTEPGSGASLALIECDECSFSRAPSHFGFSVWHPLEVSLMNRILQSVCLFSAALCAATASAALTTFSYTQTDTATGAGMIAPFS